MSRSKKSRKPGSAPTAKPKLSKEELASVEKRVRKKKGKQPGNRQQEAMQSEQNTGQQTVKKDPRLGNKTPIALGKLVAKAEKSQKVAVKKTAPMAAVRFEQEDEKVPSLSAEDELNAIEQDEKLQDILAKQEEEVALTEQEVDYYNKLMDRHEQLSAELDVEDGAEESASEVEVNDSEDDLWDKLDRSIDKSDYSDFEDK